LICHVQKVLSVYLDVFGSFSRSLGLNTCNTHTTMVNDRLAE